MEHRDTLKAAVSLPSDAACVLNMLSNVHCAQAVMKIILDTGTKEDPNIKYWQEKWGTSFKKAFEFIQYSIYPLKKFE